LNIKPNFWKDLITDEPFTRKDIITIQDPTSLDKFNLASFYHIRKNLKLVSEGVVCWHLLQKWISKEVMCMMYSECGSLVPVTCRSTIGDRSFSVAAARV